MNRILSLNISNLERMAKSAGLPFTPKQKYVIGEAISTKSTDTNFDSYVLEMVLSITSNAGKREDELMENMDRPENQRALLNLFSLEIALYEVLENIGYKIEVAKDKRKLRKDFARFIENPSKWQNQGDEYYVPNDESLSNWRFADILAKRAFEGRPPYS